MEIEILKDYISIYQKKDYISSFT